MIELADLVEEEKKATRSTHWWEKNYALAKKLSLSCLNFWLTIIL